MNKLIEKILENIEQEEKNKQNNGMIQLKCLSNMCTASDLIGLDELPSKRIPLNTKNFYKEKVKYKPTRYSPNNQLNRKYFF